MYLIHLDIGDMDLANWKKSAFRGVAALRAIGEKYNKADETVYESVLTHSFAYMFK